MKWDNPSRLILINQLIIYLEKRAILVYNKMFLVNKKYLILKELLGFCYYHLSCFYKSIYDYKKCEIYNSLFLNNF